jgi:hypothetical protein
MKNGDNRNWDLRDKQRIGIEFANNKMQPHKYEVVGDYQPLNE